MAMGSEALPDTDPEVCIPSARLKLLNRIEIPGKDKLHELVIAGAKHSGEFKEPEGLLFIWKTRGKKKKSGERIVG